MSEPDNKMLLLFEFLPKKNNADKKKIKGTPHSRMFLNMFPRLFHFFAPMNVVKNKNGI